MKLKDVEVFICPHCNIPTQSNKIAGQIGYEIQLGLSSGKPKSISDLHQQDVYTHAIYKCVNCERDTYFLLKQVNLRDALKRPKHQLPLSVYHQYPVPSMTSHQAVLQSVKLAAIEAEKCFSAGAYNACGVMTRRAIHCLCQNKNAKGKDLFAQLEDLRDRHLLTPALWEWAEEIRVAGKIGAHPEWGNLTREDAEHALRFLQETIKHVYVMPAELAAKRLKGGEAKKQENE